MDPVQHSLAVVHPNFFSVGVICCGYRHTAAKPCLFGWRRHQAISNSSVTGLLPLMARCIFDDPRTFEKRKKKSSPLPLCPWEPGQEREGLHLNCNDQTTAAVTCHVAFWLPAALCGPFSTLCLSKPTHSSANRLGIGVISTHTVKYLNFCRTA